MPTKDSQNKRQNLIYWRPESLKEQHQGDNGRDLGICVIESKGSVKVARRITLGEKIECDTEINLSNCKIGKGMPQLPMAKFMSQNGYDFAVFYLFK
mmetsp:Transcript_55033/g.61489  ORF Transcript_55033/g.61489 Transcript_55033/m.61489 type:complete len:97 (+) Transcript_55033:326-616(+)